MILGLDVSRLRVFAGRFVGIKAWQRSASQVHRGHHWPCTVVLLTKKKKIPPIDPYSRTTNAKWVAKPQQHRARDSRRTECRRCVKNQGSPGGAGTGTTLSECRGYSSHRTMPAILKKRAESFVSRWHGPTPKRSNLRSCAATIETLPRIADQASTTF